MTMTNPRVSAAFPVQVRTVAAEEVVVVCWLVYWVVYWAGGLISSDRRNTKKKTDRREDEGPV